MLTERHTGVCTPRHKEMTILERLLHQEEGRAPPWAGLGVGGSHRRFRTLPEVASWEVAQNASDDYTWSSTCTPSTRMTVDIPGWRGFFSYASRFLAPGNGSSSRLPIGDVERGGSSGDNQSLGS